MGSTLQLNKNPGFKQADKKTYQSQRIKKSKNLAEYRYEPLTEKQKDKIKEIVIFLPHNFDAQHIKFDQADKKDVLKVKPQQDDKMIPDTSYLNNH